MKALKRIGLSAALNAIAAAAGLVGTVIITWHFGLAVFGVYAVNLAKIGLIMLGLEVLPGSFAQFRLQDDPEFALATPAFYILFGFAAVGLSAAALGAGIIVNGSWFILAHVFALSLQRCFDCLILARGAVSLSVSVPLVANVTRALMLFALMAFPFLSTEDSLWASLAAGSIVGQIYILIRRPEFRALLVNCRPVRSLRYLWSLRREYPGYYVNSLLKRAKEVLFPLFCDAALPGKSELGGLLVYTRTSDTVAGQIRVLEMFLIHRETRANLAKHRRRILLGSAAIGHVGVIVVSTFMLWKHGVTATSIFYAAVMGLFMYPYVYELAKRSDAYARHAPQDVTLSILAYMTALATTLTGAWLLDLFIPPVLIAGIVFAQGLSAAVYALRASQAGKSTRLIKPTSSPDGMTHATDQQPEASEAAAIVEEHGKF